MPMLTINEVTIPQSADSGTESFEVIGDLDRAYDGTWRESRTSEKRRFDVRTTVLAQDVGEALKLLLQGRGHVWSFDSDRYSSKGLGPSTGAAAGTITGGGKFGSYMALSAAEQITWPTGFGDPATNDYTILLFEDSGAPWDRWAIKNVQGTVTKFLNGATTGAATPFVSVDSSGDITIGDGAGAFDIDDLVFVPFALPDSWLETGGGLDNPARAFPLLPRIDIDGDLVNNQVMLAQGRNVRVRAERNSVSGDKYGHIVSAELVEV